MGNETIAAIVGSVVGGILAIVGTWLLAWRQASADEKAIRSGLINEFEEAKERLISTVYLLATHRGTLDRKLLEWVRDQSVRDGKPSTLNAIAMVIELLKIDEREIAGIVAARKATGDNGLGVKMYDLAFLDAQLGRLGHFDVEEQKMIFEIRSRVRLINQEIEQCRFYFKASFTPGLAQNNQESLRNNTLVSYKSIETGSKRAVELINKYINGR